MSDNFTSTSRLSALSLALCCALCACGPQRGSPAPAAESDREQFQGARLSSPAPVEERRLDGSAQTAPAAVPPDPAPLREPARQPSAQRNSNPDYIILQPGETVSYISALYSVTEKDLIAWNGLNSPDDVRAGQRLAIRRPAAQISVPAAREARGGTADDGSVIVEPGQSLSVIAARHGVSTAELRQWNNLRSDVVKAGQRLRIEAPPRPLARADGALGTSSAAHPAEDSTGPRAGKNARAAGISGADAPDAEGMVTVKPGQSLSGIAAKYRVSMQNLRQWNKLRGDVLQAGRRLLVQRVHTVRAGESLSGIAAKYKVSPRALMQKNNIAVPDLVPEGRRLVIPNEP